MTEVKYPPTGSGTVSGATAPIQYSSGIISINTSTTALTEYLQLSGGTMTGDIVLQGAPTLANHPANKGYVDTIETTLQGNIDTNTTNISTNSTDISTLDSAAVKITGNQTIAGDKTFSGNVDINNLVVTGTSTEIKTSTFTIDSTEFFLNNDETGAPTENCFFGVKRGTSDNAFISWNETNDYWDLGVANNTVSYARFGEDVTIRANYTNGSAGSTLVMDGGDGTLYLGSEGSSGTSGNFLWLGSSSSLNYAHIAHDNDVYIDANFDDGVSGSRIFCDGSLGDITISTFDDFIVNSGDTIEATSTGKIDLLADHTAGSNGGRVFIGDGSFGTVIEGFGQVALTSNFSAGSTGGELTVAPGSSAGTWKQKGAIQLDSNNAVRFSVNDNNCSSVAINNVTTASSANVFINSSTAQLFRSTSSARYKTNIEPLEASFRDKALLLEPVWYRSTGDKDNPSWSYYGLIAEQVAGIEPRLVHWSYAKDDLIPDPENPGSLTHKEGAVLIPEAVMYDRLTVFNLALHQANLKERKRLRQIIKAQEAAIAELRAEIQKIKEVM